MSIDDDIILPIIVAISAIIFTIGYQTLTAKSSVEPLRLELDQVYISESAALREVDSLTKELKSYRATASELESLGASHRQAIQAIKAAELYNLDPKMLGALIASESSFISRHHAIPNVVGLCGINLNANPDVPYEPYNDFGNILDSAFLLKEYLVLYRTYPLAIKRYKGWSDLGRSQAHTVMGIYRTIK